MDGTPGSSGIIWRGERWIKPIRPAEAIAMFDYQAGFFTRSAGPELYALTQKNVWMQRGPAFRRLYQNLHSVGLDVFTGELIVGGQLMSPENLFKGVAKGTLSQIPPEIVSLRELRAKRQAKRMS